MPTPGQTLAQWQSTLAQTIALQPEHVSSYCLTYEEDTEYFRQLKLGTFRQDDERDAALFETTIDTLTAAGFDHYEISNYARSGFESAHNFAYWRGADYLGFGPSAFSTVGLHRWQNIPDTATYTERVLAGEPVAQFSEELSPATREGEIAAFAVRTREGIATMSLGRWRGDSAANSASGSYLEDRGDLSRLTRRSRRHGQIPVAEAFV